MSPRTAIYVRISSDPDGERAGVERQRIDCEALAARMGLTVAQIYEDNDVSAYKKKKRPQFERMLKDALYGDFTHLIVWAADRLYRKIADLERIVSTLEHRVAIHSVQSGDFDFSTADGRMTARIHGTIAQHAAEKTAERVKRQVQQRTSEGTMGTGRRPYGWRWTEPCDGAESCQHVKPHTPGFRKAVGSLQGLVPDPAEAPLIKDAYLAVLDGRSLNSIARDLRAAGMAGMTTSLLRGNLMMARHAGLVSLHGDVVREAADGYSIVDRETWDGVRSLILSRKGKRPGRPSGGPGKTLLGGGLFVCPNCGVGMAAGGYEEGVRRYRCPKSDCQRKMSETDQAVLDAVGSVVGRVGGRGWLSASERAETATSDIRAKIQTQENNLEQLATLMSTGDLNPIDFAAAASRIREDLNESYAQLSQHVRRTATGRLHDDPRGAKAAYQSLRDQPDQENLRVLLRELITVVRISDDHGLIIEWAPWTRLPQTVIAPPNGRQRRATKAAVEKRRQRVAELWAEGHTTGEIVKIVGWSRNAIYSDLRIAGVREAFTTRASRKGDLHRAEALRLRRTGLSLKEIAAEMGMSYGSIARYMTDVRGEGLDIPLQEIA